MAEDRFPPPLNMSDHMDDMTAITAGCMLIKDQDGLMGVFTVVTQIGHYDFVVTESTANEMIQALRELLRGDSESLI
jgi:hypothetical protein